MKILLTGQPHSGKSTLLSRLIENIKDKQGFVTREIPDPSNPGLRVGFELVSAGGDTATLAHIGSDSDIRVSRYGVEIDKLNDFLRKLNKFTPTQLLYIDEVGQMQLNSEAFQSLVKKYIAAPNNYIGTITSVYNDEFVEQLKNNSEVEIIEVTSENRNRLFTELRSRLGGFEK